LFGNDIIALNMEQEADAFLRAELAKAAPTNRRRTIEKFVLAALGSIPWIGGFLSAVAAYKTDDSLYGSVSPAYAVARRACAQDWPAAQTRSKR
jgi:hypothetical protein